jgi:general secretion pathway protein K
MMRTPKTEQRGLALVAVLWLVALLTALATAAVTISVGRARVVRATGEHEQARLLADSAIRLTLVELASPQSTRSASDASRDVEALEQNVRVEISLEDERLNLNTADRNQLQTFLGRQSSAATGVLASRIEHWRTVHSQQPASAIELGDYRRAGFDYAARRAPFESPEEVRQILDVDGVAPGRLDVVTVYGQSREPTSSPNRQITVGDVIRVQACTQARGAVCRTAVVRLTGSRRDPLQTFSWK